jgi:hypothetical protein
LINEHGTTEETFLGENIVDLFVMFNDHLFIFIDDLLSLRWDSSRIVLNLTSKSILYQLGGVLEGSRDCILLLSLSHCLISTVLRLGFLLEEVSFSFNGSYFIE